MAPVIYLSQDVITVLDTNRRINESYDDVLRRLFNLDDTTTQQPDRQSPNVSWRRESTS